MNVVIFGASGATGRLLTKRAIDAGHNVTVLIRPTAHFPSHSRLAIARGSVFDSFHVADAIQGADVVLSALGARSLSQENVLERAVPNIIEAMHQTGRHHKPVRRIIVLGSAGALPSALDKQTPRRRWVVENILYKTLLKWPVASQVAQYAALSASDLDWTMVMPPMLTNAPALGTYRIDPDALPPGATHISRQDVADFMMFLLQTDSRNWYRKGVYIAY